MRIEMLQTVEDSNEFPLDEPLAGKQAFTIGHRVHKWHISRVDKLIAGTKPDLPESQALDLVNLGYAATV